MLSRSDEQHRRWLVAVEANRLRYGGIRILAQITGLDEKPLAAVKLISALVILAADSL